MNDEGWKPKGMHWRTFERLTAEHDAFVNQALVWMALQLGLLQERLDSLEKK